MSIDITEPLSSLDSVQAAIRDLATANASLEAENAKLKADAEYGRKVRAALAGIDYQSAKVDVSAPCPATMPETPTEPQSDPRWSDRYSPENCRLQVERLKREGKILDTSWDDDEDHDSETYLADEVYRDLVTDARAELAKANWVKGDTIPMNVKVIVSEMLTQELASQSQIAADVGISAGSVAGVSKHRDTLQLIGESTGKAKAWRSARNGHTELNERTELDAGESADIWTFVGSRFTRDGTYLGNGVTAFHDDDKIWLEFEGNTFRAVSAGLNAPWIVHHSSDDDMAPTLAHLRVFGAQSGLD